MAEELDLDVVNLDDASVPGYSGRGFRGRMDPVTGVVGNPVFVPATLTMEQPVQALANSDAQISINSNLPPATLSLNINMREVVRITENGFYFMGERVEDPHRVYNIFTDWAYRASGMPSPVEQDEIDGVKPLVLCGKSRYELARKA